MSETVHKYILTTLIKMYTADVAKAQANIEIYLKNPVGIGDHSDVLGAIDEQVSKMAEAQDKIEVLNRYYED